MALQRYITAFEDEVQVVASIDIGTLWDRMRGEFLNEYARLTRNGVTGDELERELNAFVDGLSDRPEVDLSRKSSSVSYNQGRNAEIMTAKESGAAQYVVRSEVLDENTCEECANLDGAVFEIGTSAYHQARPPAFCRGGDRCRGFYVAVSGGGIA